MKDEGKLPESFTEVYESMKADYEAQTYKPAPPVKYCYDSFWKIRMTKAFESPINHTDLSHFQELNRIVLNIWEVDAILKFDSAYYHFAKKHKD